MLFSADVQIKAYTEAKELVKNAAVLVHAGTAFVGIITAPIFTKSQRTTLVAELMTELADKFDVEKVVISLDLQTYHNILKANELIEAGKDPADRIARIKA